MGLALAALLSPALALAASPLVSITAPASNAAVSNAQAVSGIAQTGIHQVWVLVHQTDSDQCWAQGPADVRRDHSWRLKAQFGSAGEALPGKAYEVRAIAKPRLDVETGPSPCGLEAGVYSDAVYVTGK
jgi:hypothetical protein